MSDEKPVAPAKGPLFQANPEPDPGAEVKPEDVARLQIVYLANEPVVLVTGGPAVPTGSG